MFSKIIIKFLIIFFLFVNLTAKANDIASMSNISEAAGSSAQAAADQLASDANQVVENISGATEALGEAKSDIGKALDVSIAQAENAMSFATESLAKGDITSADLLNYVLASEKIDTIIHAAAQSHVDTSFGNSFSFSRFSRLLLSKR